MDKRPIGVFDSGLGGLTVVRELRCALPEESIVYLGDTARVPYGPRSKQTVIRFARQDAYFLAAKNVKVIVVACNTASAQAYDDLCAHFDLPVASVIPPATHAAVNASGSSRIGVLGTVGTISSGAYQRAISAIRPGAHVVAVPCPLFVPLAEEGEGSSESARLIAAQYLEPLIRERVDVVILGCTHYPLLHDVIATTLGEGVMLIDSGLALAHELRARLAADGLGAPPGAQPTHRYFVTDRPIQFQEVAERFLGQRMDADMIRVDLD